MGHHLQVCLLVAAEFDAQWAKQQRPDPQIKPRSHAARIRLDSRYDVKVRESQKRGKQDEQHKSDFFKYYQYLFILLQISIQILHIQTHIILIHIMHMTYIHVYISEPHQPTMHISISVCITLFMFSGISEQDGSPLVADPDRPAMVLWWSRPDAPSSSHFALTKEGRRWKGQL